MSGKRRLVAALSRSGLRTALDLALLTLAVAALVLGAVVFLLHLHLQPVLSGSMRPGIQPGDLAITRPVPAGSLEPGDVIVYYPPGQPEAVIHRLVSGAVRADGLWIATRGDFDMPDDPNGVKAEGSVEFDAATGAITGITVTTPGSGYVNAPAAVIYDGTLFDPIIGGTGATATATLSVQSVVLDAVRHGLHVGAHRRVQRRRPQRRRDRRGPPRSTMAAGP